MEQLVAALKQTLIDFSAGRVQQPVRSVLEISKHGGWFALMPAVFNDLMGAKLVTVFPSNTKSGIPTHLAMIALFRADTGESLAVMDGRLITEMRTAAVSAIATEILAPADGRVLAILGSGVQAKSHLEALCNVRCFEEIRVWSRTQEHASRFSAENKVKSVESAEAAVRDADVIITVTGSPTPILDGDWLKPGAYVNAVGAVGPKRRELDDKTMEDAVVIVESREAALQESGDILLTGASVYAELGELLAGKPKVEGRRTVFKSLGIACEDLAAAQLVYQTLQIS
jgi:ornithine cyclodeaminase/alanine dehydrogenase-like protein (mu-crystallin family)